MKTVTFHFAALTCMFVLTTTMCTLVLFVLASHIYAQDRTRYAPYDPNLSSNPCAQTAVVKQRLHTDWRITQGKSLFQHILERKTSSTLITKSSSLFLTDQSKSKTIISSSGKLQLKSTTMTFNDKLIVHCKESPFIVCSKSRINQQSRATNSTRKTFKISFLKRPKWIPRHTNMRSCRFNQCTMVDNNVKEETDLVVVYGVRLRDMYTPPKIRWPHQRYALAIWEPPQHTSSNFSSQTPGEWNHRFNLTLTYRVDSDIFVPYSRLKFSPKPLHKRPNYYEIASKKTKMVAWFVSHCKTHSKRELYVRELMKYIDVDVIGKCGQPCPQSNSTCNSQPNDYKFYLSFENSLCTDYITEKFFKLFTPELHVIPVVRGGADYDKYFPNFTFINAAHFKTPKDLAFHLKNLASDLRTYSKYLEYIDLYKIYGNLHQYTCDICEYLQTLEHFKPKTYNLKSWYVDGHCFAPKDYRA